MIITLSPAIVNWQLTCDSNCVAELRLPCSRMLILLSENTMQCYVAYLTILSGVRCLRQSPKKLFSNASSKGKKTCAELSKELCDGASLKTTIQQLVQLF